MSKLGLLPLVKRFWIHRYFTFDGTPVSPEYFNWCIRRQISGLTNVQVLEIDDLDIPGFIPGGRQYFGPFLPTVRSLLLRAPRGSPQQTIFFIGLFQHLEDLTLLGPTPEWHHKPVDDPTLVPPFTPPLRGRLGMVCFMEADFVKVMIDLFGGIRFRYMDIFGVRETRLLLGACARTLETLRLHLNDPCGE